MIPILKKKHSNFNFKFAENLRLTLIESNALRSESDRITLSSAVLAVTHDASPDSSRLSLCGEDSWREFGRQRRLANWTQGCIFGGL
jgi:hypothetical protein